MKTFNLVAAGTAVVAAMAITATLRGKVEFDVSEEGRESEVLEFLARRATADAWRAHLGGSEVRPLLTALVEWFDAGNSLVAGDLVSSTTLLDELGPMEGLGALMSQLEPDLDSSPALLASCVEFAVEGLWLTRRIDKDVIGGVSRYASA